ncbi:GntP family permease [Anaerobranca gottschalkii]|uniref:H+/gluconate symporter n=1 Tax=Anaerobranca gottschalkii DSM 13577 TaxID=1120990 RepID=A0A1H9ZPT7_9FIRM|nr:GntP family permease [Anaerobranca gottschalkii]SES82845.1 H+/gluconate symporter [Anaerobranca gottschalkii DSM 13577]
MLGIIIGLVLLMVLAYRGMSIIWIAPICALLVALSGGLELLPAYTDTYMTGFVGFTKSWFPVFMLGAIFGKLMEDTGAAKSVAAGITKLIGKKRAILAVVVGCAVLTYGGVSLFVVVFAMYPLAVAVFREANISRKLIPGAIALGSFTFTMTAVPGTPQIQNLIPTKYYGTTAAAAPIMGIAAALVMAVGGYLYLTWKERKLTAAGEVFTEPSNYQENGNGNLPNPILSCLPLVSVIVTLNLLEWHIIVALFTGIILTIILNFNYFKTSFMERLIKTINAGASGSVIAIINTSAAVGFGSVVRAVPGFQTLTDMVLGIKGNPLISQALAVNLLAGATGSASGGMGIALEALGEKYVELANAAGMSLEAFHRVASISSGGLDTLPHNGAVLTLLAITGLTHKDSYIDIFVVGSLIPIASVVVAIIFASLGLV